MTPPGSLLRPPAASADSGAKGGLAPAESPHLDDVGRLRLLGEGLPPGVVGRLRDRFGERVE